MIKFNDFREKQNTTITPPRVVWKNDQIKTNYSIRNENK